LPARKTERITALSAKKSRSAGAKRTSQPRDKPAVKLEKLITTTLEDAKALDVTSIDLAGKSPMADYMIVASGRSQRHVGAIADQLARKLKDEGHGKVRIEGLPHCDWVLIDASDVIVHVFRPEVREFYNLERLWSASPDKKLAG
jgi:ribosome-associated protein